MENSQKINIILEFNGQKHYQKIRLSEKVRVLLRYFRGDYKFNGKLINPDDRFSELGIKDGDTINVIPSEEIIAGGCIPCIEFVDVEKNHKTKIEFKINAPEWRHVSEGLNLFGTCPNENCVAYNEEVIFMATYEKTNCLQVRKESSFNLNEEIENIKCPMCKKLIDLTTCGFYNCKYQFDGRKKEHGDVKNYKSEIQKTEGEYCEYFDVYKNGKVTWLELKIYIYPLNEKQQQSKGLLSYFFNWFK